MAIKKIKLKELVIWSDNPRYDVSNDEELTGLSEQELIDMLWEQIGAKEMKLLCKSLNDNSFRESRLPIVVHEDNQYKVYDGNRRIACAKLIAINDERTGLSEFRITTETKLSVVISSKENALIEMDEIHSGTNAGRIIPWESYQRDKSLVMRNQEPKYTYAYPFAVAANMSKKADFAKINYTDLDSILSNNRFMGILNNYFNNPVEQLNILKRYKDKISQPWSRYLPKFNSSAEERESFHQFVANDSTTSDNIDNFEITNTTISRYAREAFNLKELLKVKPRSANLDNISFDLNNSGLSMDTSTGFVHANNAPREYPVFVIYEEFRIAITLVLKSHKRPSPDSTVRIIDNDFFDDTYDLISTHYPPIAYLIDYLNKTECNNQNIYAIAILYRQFIEFTYKVYAIAVLGNPERATIIGHSLAGGINGVNNELVQQKVLSPDIRNNSATITSVIPNIQDNAHNIDTIVFDSIKGLHNVLVPFLSHIIYKIHEAESNSGQN